MNNRNVLVMVWIPKLPLPRALDGGRDEGQDDCRDDAGHSHDAMELRIWLRSARGELTSCGTHEECCWNGHDY